MPTPAPFYDSIREEVRRNEFVVVKLAGIDLKSRSYIHYSKKKPLSTAAQKFLTLLRASRHIDRVMRLGKTAPAVLSETPLRRRAAG